MTSQNQQDVRRKLIQTALWTTPIVLATTLPSHAQSSDITSPTTTPPTITPSFDYVRGQDVCNTLFDDTSIDTDIFNTSSISVEITAITTTVSNASFTFTPTLPTTLAPGDSINVFAQVLGLGGDCPDPSTYTVTTTCCGDFIPTERP